MSFRSWATSDVVRQLKFLGFGQYASHFQANEICGVHLPLLTEAHLLELGVNSIGHRILMLRRFFDIAHNMPVSPMEQESVRPMPSQIPNPPTKSVQQVVPKDTPQKLIAATARKKSPAVLPKTPDARSIASLRSIRAHDSMSVASETPKCFEKEWHIVGRSDQFSNASSVMLHETQNFDAGNIISCQHCGKKLPDETASRHIRICARVNHNRALKR
jgi:hypothetical protein